MKIIIIGPAWPLRGGLASFDQRLCRTFNEEGHQCSVYSFSLQYPGFLFPGTSQYSSEPPPAGIEIHPVINSMNPFNWLVIGNRLKKVAPDLIVVRYWLPVMGPALGTILRKVRLNQKSKIIAITDNVLPHEKRPGDRSFTKYFLGSCDAFVTMSDSVMNDLRQFEKTKPAKTVIHPVYDNFGEIIPKVSARKFLHEQLRLSIAEEDKIILFFGFIRKYKGLDILFRAMSDAAGFAHVAGARPTHQRLDLTRLFRLEVEHPFLGLGRARLHGRLRRLVDSCDHGRSAHP